MQLRLLPEGCAEALADARAYESIEAALGDSAAMAGGGHLQAPGWLLLMLAMLVIS